MLMSEEIISGSLAQDFGFTAGASLDFSQAYFCGAVKPRIDFFAVGLDA